MSQQEGSDVNHSSPVYPNICLAVRIQELHTVRGLTLCPGQTFEGGISGAPDTEAHGAYAFCALACLSILGPPQEYIRK